ncbi:MAG: hypothetical protein JWQ71_4466 [Pedosphaera sp.]|nr:hypothetical protein [Pedosphaera sp.]
MNKSYNIQESTRLLIAGILIWIALALFCFIPRQVTIDLTHHASSGTTLLGATQFALMYFGVSAALLLKDFTVGKGVSPLFMHFQVMASIIPLAFLMTGILFLVYARLRLGYFPQPRRPDPSLIGLGLLQFVVAWITSVAGSLVGYAFLYKFKWVKWTSFRWCCPGILCCTSAWLAVWLVTKYDPLHFFDWLAD